MQRLHIAAFGFGLAGDEGVDPLSCGHGRRPSDAELAAVAGAEEAGDLLERRNHLGRGVLRLGFPMASTITMTPDLGHLVGLSLKRRARAGEIDKGRKISLDFLGARN